MKINVSKYHGCGNDFILLDQRETKKLNPEKMDEFVRAVCDRHTGIGADGLIVAREKPFFMEYYNSDGSRADMCGNGIRCLAKFLMDEQKAGLWNFPIETLAGTKYVSIQNLYPWFVQIGMGKPEFDNEKIKVDPSEKVWCREIETSLGTFTVYSFYMGCTHTVLFVEDPFNPKWEQVGKEICHHPLYQDQTNVDFVEVIDDHTIKATTYERGSGPTLACGTGMCASAVTSFLLNETTPVVDVIMKKGMLHIEIDEDQNVTMAGPARKILKGEFEYEQNPA